MYIPVIKMSSNPSYEFQKQVITQFRVWSSARLTKVSVYQTSDSINALVAVRNLMRFLPSIVSSNAKNKDINLHGKYSEVPVISPSPSHSQTCPAVL